MSPDDAPVRESGCFTEDLHAMAAWLSACGITVAALESTGAYWVPVFEVLEAHGIAVVLASAHSVRNVPDCQWLQQLMGYGLLAAAFRPPAEVCAVSRRRGTLPQEQARCVPRMQKALTLMNVRLANALTGIAGQTGLAIIRAIVAGGTRRRSPGCATTGPRPARPASPRAWKDEHLSCLGQALSLYDTYRQLAAEGSPKKRGGKNAPGPDAREALRERAGADLARIGGIDVSAALKVLVELGPDLSKSKSAKHFCLWLGLCPGTRISGGKRLPGTGKRIPDRVARALKLAAQGLRHSQCGAGRVLPADGGAAGQGQGHHRPQAGPAGLRDADARGRVRRAVAGPARGKVPKVAIYGILRFAFDLLAPATGPLPSSWGWAVLVLGWR